MEYILLLYGFIAVFIFMPLNFNISKFLMLVDIPNERKVNVEKKWRGGGISIYLAFIFFIIFAYIFTQRIELLGIMVSSLILFISGILDDKYTLPAYTKLSLQTLSAIVAFLFHIKITKLNIFFDTIHLTGFFSFFLTVFWIILLINAINLIDGLDGLASGTSIIILVTLLIFTEDYLTKLIGFVLIGTLFSFLKYNFYPSRIILGDTGSMFLGYIIAILSLIGFTKSVVGITSILLMVSFPLLDTFLAIIRRKLNNQPIFSPDKNHIHHCFLKKGYSQKQSVFLIYIINIAFALLALFGFYLSNTTFPLLVFFTFSFLLIYYLRILPIDFNKKHK